MTRDAQSGLLKGQVAVVTGAARGIGNAVARRFAEEGACVLLGDIRAEQAEQAAAEIRQAGGQAIGCALDVTEEASIQRSLQRCLETFGRLNVLVANAGILFNAPLLETSRADWDRVLSVNLTGVFLCLQVFGRHLVSAGQGGRILATSSTAGKRGSRLHGAYCASKFGVIGLLQSFAAEMASHDILVNGVCPGNVATPMGEEVVANYSRLLDRDPDEARRMLYSEAPMARAATADEVANAFVYLASPLSTFVTGTTLHVDGGMVMR